MDALAKLLLILLFCSFLTIVLGDKKIDSDEDEEPVGRRRWEEEILDDDDFKPRQKMTRINVNFRRAGKKPRVRVHGPPLKMKSPGLASGKYLANPYLSGYKTDAPFFPHGYMPMTSGGLSGLSPNYGALSGLSPNYGALSGLSPNYGTALSGLSPNYGAALTGLSPNYGAALSGLSPNYGAALTGLKPNYGAAFSKLSPNYAAGLPGLGERSYFPPLKKSIGSQPFLKSPRNSRYLYLPVNQQQLFLAQLLSSALKENNIKPTDLLLANYRATLEDAGIIPPSVPSSNKANRYKDKENSKLLHQSESTKSTYYPHKDHNPSSQSSSSYASPHYPSPNYPSPYTLQEVPPYREYPSPYYEHETDTENRFEYLENNQKYPFDAMYSANHEPSFSVSHPHLQYEEPDSDYPMDIRLRRKEESALANHKVE